MLEIEKAFNTTGQSIYDFFQKPGMGLYIPLYQREYSWDKDNVGQLLEDIARGIERLVETEDDSEIRFLGTIITVTEKNHNKIEPIDWTALPTAVDKVIDGQQRLSTICLFACQLYKHIDALESRLLSFTDLKEDVEESCESWKGKLLDIFSLDLKRGKPKRKPKIIRGSDDKWIKEGIIDESYKSALANYLAKFINHIELGDTLPEYDKSNVGKNAARINRWLETDIALAHVNQDDTFTPAWSILEKLNEKYIWNYPRVELKSLVVSKEISNKKGPEFFLCSLVQVFAVCHYLLQRCCFTLIQPANDDWAFDMFQSLNASGTPLTAIETFKPLVVNTITKNNSSKSFKGTLASKSFGKIERLFASATTAAQKSKLTNDFLTSFAITVNAEKLTNHFSYQRKWLDQIYNSFENSAQQEEYVNYMGAYAEFYKKWYDYNGEGNKLFEPIQSNHEADLASMLILYLKESGHKMSITILAFLYCDILKGKDDSIANFVSGVKAVAAFYTIWRSALPNSGLDNVYRQFFRGEKDATPNYWLKKKSLSVEALKAHFMKSLETTERGIGGKDKWISRASNYLNYKSRVVTKFLLMTCAHDTIADDKFKGLMKEGTIGIVKYLCLEKWKSNGCKTIEHIAPQSNDSNLWDPELYQDPEELYQRIGNLTMLPISVNSSVGNKSWKEKLLYYKHLSEQDPDKLTELSNKASNASIILKVDTIEVLKDAEYNDHIKSIVTVGDHGNWNGDLVRLRTERILSISWNRLTAWLTQ